MFKPWFLALLSLLADLADRQHLASSFQRLAKIWSMTRYWLHFFFLSFFFLFWFRCHLCSSLFFFVFIFVNVLFLSSKMSIKRIKETIPPKHCEWKRCSRCSWKHCRQPFFKTFQEMFQNLILEDWPSRRHFLKCLKRHFAKTFPKTFPSFGVMPIAHW